MDITRSDEVENLTSIIKEDELSVMIRDLKGDQCDRCGGKEDEMYVEIKDKESFNPLEMTVDDLKLVCPRHKEETGQVVQNSDDEEIILEDEEESFDTYIDNNDSGVDGFDDHDNDYNDYSSIEEDENTEGDTKDDEDDNPTNKHNIFLEKSISSEVYGGLTILTFIISLISGLYIVESYNSNVEALTLIPILLGSIVYGLIWDLRYYKKITDKEETGVGKNITILLFTSLLSIGFISLYGLGIIVIESLIIIGSTNLVITYNIEKISKYDSVELTEDNVIQLVDNPESKESDIDRILSDRKQDIEVINKFRSNLFRFIAHVGGFSGFLTAFILAYGTSISYVFVLLFLISPIVALTYMIYRTKWYNKFVDD